MLLNTFNTLINACLVFSGSHPEIQSFAGAGDLA